MFSQTKAKQTTWVHACMCKTVCLTASNFLLFQRAILRTFRSIKRIYFISLFRVAWALGRTSRSQNGKWRITCLSFSGAVIAARPLSGLPGSRSLTYGLSYIIVSIAASWRGTRCFPRVYYGGDRVSGGISGLIALAGSQSKRRATLIPNPSRWSS